MQRMACRLALCEPTRSGATRTLCCNAIYVNGGSDERFQARVRVQPKSRSASGWEVALSRRPATHPPAIGREGTHRGRNNPPPNSDRTGRVISGSGYVFASAVLLLQDVAARRILQRRMVALPMAARLAFSAGAGREPGRPVRATSCRRAASRFQRHASAVAGGASPASSSPVGALAARRVDDPGDMAAGARARSARRRRRAG